MPRLEALATAVPEHRVTQADVRDIAQAFLEERAPDLLPLLSVFDSSGIDQRFIAEEFAWYLAHQGWRARSEEFIRVGTDLCAAVATAVLERAALPATAVDGIVLVTTTGLSTPSLEARLANRLRLRADVQRVPVWGLGCAGGVAGLARTADLARAHPQKRFLFLSVELCSLAFLRADVSKKNLVAAAIFGDGCAGALVSGDHLAALGPSIGASRSHLWPDTERVMGWDVQDEGLSVVFSRDIPELVEERMRPIVRGMLKEEGADPAETRHLFHPGGLKVIEAYERGLALPPTAFEDTRAVLRGYGNMSSPTALFVLERSLARSPLAPGEPALLAALGPGFACELALLTG